MRSRDLGALLIFGGAVAGAYWWAKLGEAEKIDLKVHDGKKSKPKPPAPPSAPPIDLTEIDYDFVGKQFRDEQRYQWVVAEGPGPTKRWCLDTLKMHYVSNAKCHAVHTLEGVSGVLASTGLGSLR